MKVVGNIASDSEVVATASGAITAGKPVLVNADGTVSTCIDASGGFGTAVEFESGATQSPDGPFKSTFDSNSNKVIIGYEDQGNSNYGTAVVATIDPSDNSVSYGTPVVFESGHTGYIDLSFDSNVNKVVIAFQDIDDSYACKAVIGTVSGTSISFGSAVTFKARTGANSILNNTLVFDSNANKTAVFYVDFDDSQKLFCRVISISGTTPSYGTEVEVVGQTQYGSDSGITATFDSNSNKVVVFYIDSGDSNKGKARVGTISGTDISFGTAAVFESDAYPFSAACAFDSTNNKTVNIYRDSANSSYGTATVGTVSGTDISFGTPVVYTSHSVNVQGCVYDSSVNRIIVLYRNSAAGDKGHYNVAQVSGTTLDFGTAAIYLDFTTSNTPYGTYDSNAERILLPYRDTQDSNKGKAVVMQTPVAGNLTTENFIGFAKDNVADGAVATIQTANSIARDNIGEPITLSGGTATVFESANTTLLASTFDSSNNKIVIAYRDNGNSEYGTAIVGTVSGTDITFGSPTVFESASIGFMGEDSIVFDSNANKVVIVYEDEGNSQYGTAIVGTVSGTSISFGSPTVFESAACFSIAATFDSSNNKVVVAYEDQGNSEHGTAIVGTVSGTSISFGSATVFNAGDTLNIDTTFDSTNNKVVIAYTDAANSNQGTAIVGTVSGTSISFGSEAVFDTSTGSKAGSGNKSSITFDSNQNKVLVSYVDVGDSEHGKAIVGTVSGTSISFGTASTFESATTSELSSAFDSDAKVVIIAYKDEGNSSYGTAITASISGTSVSFGTPVAYKTSRADEVSITYDSSNNKTVAAFGDVGNSEYGTAVVISADSSLTIGQTYFVQTDGTLSTSADDPSVIAGTAISGTDLIVKG